MTPEVKEILLEIFDQSYEELQHLSTLAALARLRDKIVQEFNDESPYLKAMRARLRDLERELESGS